MPEPEYSIKGVRFRYDRPRSGTDGGPEVPLVWNISGICAQETCHHKPVIKYMIR